MELREGYSDLGAIASFLEAILEICYCRFMILMYQYRLQPTPNQAATLSHQGELLGRHWNYCLGCILDWLRCTRGQIDRCSLISELIGEIPSKVDYYSQAAKLKDTKLIFPEYKDIYSDCQQQNLMRLDKIWKRLADILEHIASSGSKMRQANS